MKKTFLHIASLAPVAMIAACSDGGSSTPSVPDQVAVESSSSVSNPYTDPVVNYSSSSQQVVDPILLSSSSGSTASQPISEEEKVDDGTSSVASLTVGVSGVAEVGPLNAGSLVTVSSVDAKTMTVGAAAITATVSNNVGAYAASGALTSAIGSFEASGNYYNFTLGENASIKSLKAISDLRTRTSVNINILTHLEYARVQNLVSTQGLSFTAAKERAEKEILEAFGFNADSTLFEDISIYHMTDAAASLLALTDAMETSSTVLDDLLKMTSDDIATDGTLDEDAVKAVIGDAAYSMDVNADISNLSSANNDVDVMTYSGTKRQLWAAMFNLGSCTDANLNEVKTNQNSKSSIQDKYFACKDGGWAEASAAFVKSAEVAQTAGTCSSTNAGTVVSYTDGNQYVCKKNLWSVATADDIAAASITTACTSSNEKAVSSVGSSSFICMNGAWTKTVNAAIDYSKGRAMNQKLGRGINLGNSWDATGSDDSGWSNPIQDGDFAVIKAAGFNSVRIPVRWYTGVDTKIAGVKADVDLALAQGLTVIINFHHYEPMWEAAKSYPNGNYPSEKQTYLSIWEKVSQAFSSYADDKVVLEILNEPRDMSNDAVNDLMTSAYEVIRKNCPGKTIMFEGNGYSKFAQIQNLNLPNDGNIIVSGHYYDPYSFTHQGQSDSYTCNANASMGLDNIPKHFKSYVDSIALYFPDVNGGSVPISLGEFGVTDQSNGSGSCVSMANKATWTDAVIVQAEKYGMSWHYWAFTKAGGFEAYNRNSSSWFSEMINVFSKYLN